MVHHSDVPEKILKVLSGAVGTLLLVALFFILQYLFDMEFACLCRPSGHQNDILFLAIPPLILTVIVTLMESFYQKWMYSCCKRRYYCCNNFCSFIAKFLMKYLYLAAVWVSTVLFDGDWYFCLLTNLNTSQTGIPCKKDLTYEETLIKINYKNTSLDWGFAVISGTFLVWISFKFCIASCVRWMMWKRSSVSVQDLCCPPYYRKVYEDILSEEVSCHLEEELKQIAKDRAKKLCQKHLKTIRNHDLPDDNLNGNPNDNPNGSANNEKDIFDTWQEISGSNFYLMDEGF